MERRKILQGIGAFAALAMLPKLALGDTPKGPRILTLDMEDRFKRCFKVLKNGHQVGLVYWANLDTKEYRRAALILDFQCGPWEGGRLVRHEEYAASTEIILGQEMESNFFPRKYNIQGLPVVPYKSGSSRLSNYYQHLEPQQRDFTVEGTFDEVVLSSKAPAEVRALYPDLRVV